MARAALLIAIAALLWSGAANAQVLYKWTDAQGKVQYSDQPPKNFKGEVTRIEPDVYPAMQPSRVVAPPAPAQAPPPTLEKANPADDIGARRKATRERLAADMARARERLEAARKARAEGEAPGQDERQVVRQHYAKGTQPGMPKSNCREVTAANGKKSLMCPALVPSPAYYERIEDLEAAVKRAEEELEAAERAYRRGVD
ncbi:MAG TPA: DUF4124 domain-containing protein [Usitatibacter sp.]|nr:DUF4124 domain-containing protein [Usitatibacter sp.]